MFLMECEMATRTNLRVKGVLFLVVVLLPSGMVVAQQAAPKSRTAPRATSAVDDAARKSEILSSRRWRRAMFEMNEWLTAQRIYSPSQVAKIKADFSAKVARISADQLEFMLEDMDAKFKILETPQAREARAWLAQYLSILSDKKREEVLARLPNIGTMTAAQLQTEIGAIENRRAATQRQSKQVQQLRDTATNPWTQNTKMAEEAYVRDHTMQRSAYSSPYRAGAPTKRPFADVRTGGPDIGYYLSPYGGLGLMFSNGF